jgi:hypothetical protein
VLFEELIEQHRVHLIVTHSIDVTAFVADHEVRVCLFYVFGHESELLYAFSINLLLIAEGNRFEREQRFARFVHWFDLLFKAL